MKKWLLALSLCHTVVWAERPKVSLLSSQSTFRQLGWKARWEWQGAKTALEHMGLQVQVVDETQIVGGVTTPVLILSNARNLEDSTLQAVRRHLAGGGKLLASYQTSYKKADNSSWEPNGLALGPELGVKFTRWNGTPGETEALKLAPPFGIIPLARHQAMLVEASPDTFVLAQWDKPPDAPSVVQKEGAIYLGEDLLAPENSHSKQVLGLMASLLNRLDPTLRLALPRTSPPLLNPQVPFTPLPAQPDQASIKVGVGKLIPRQGALLLSAGKSLKDEKGKSLGRQLRLEVAKEQMWLIQGKTRLPLGQAWSVTGSPYLNCWQENPNGTVRWSAYRGSLAFKLTEQAVEGVNQLPAEGYLAGVIPSEVPFTFPAESLRAMAVVARTYAVNHLGRHAGEGFDVCSEVHCQVYRGLTQEHPYTSRAVLDTQGELLKFQDKAADTTFHACCGGHGVDVKDTWPASATLTYLAGTFDQLPIAPIADLTQEAAFRQWLDGRYPAYCSSAGRFRWEENIPWAQFEARLKPGITLLKGVEVTRRDRSGRVAELHISADPADLNVGGDSVRWLTSGGKVGAGGLQSTLFYVDVLGEGAQKTLRLRGGGWGHGVGLCQEGAAGRARAGQNYRQILSHYYPGTVLLQPDLGPPIPQRVIPKI